LPTRLSSDLRSSSGDHRHLVCRTEAWVLRHRRRLTIIAACGPLPYALIRLTWLTPWPLLGGCVAEADPSLRLWGLAISGGAWLRSEEHTSELQSRFDLVC